MIRKIIEYSKLKAARDNTGEVDEIVTYIRFVIFCFFMIGFMIGFAISGYF